VTVRIPLESILYSPHWKLNYKEYVEFLNKLYLYNLVWNSLLFS
jgi:hypothetical protein